MYFWRKINSEVYSENSLNFRTVLTKFVWKKKWHRKTPFFFGYFWIIQILHYVCHSCAKQTYKKEWNEKMICKLKFIIFVFITLFGHSWRKKKTNRISFITLKGISWSKCIFYYFYFSNRAWCVTETYLKSCILMTKKKISITY